MANYFVDSTTGDDGDNGTTMDLAWATVKHALEAGGLSAGDIVWVRRIHSETPTSDIAAAYDGTAASPIQVIGWPRPAIPNTTITEGDWTNGNPLIDDVVGITPDREKHIGRYVTAPDGKKYLITAVIWEAGVDGMAEGAEFAVGDILTNTTQTKKGKVWGFTDNEDTTGVIQYVRDSSSTWVEDDNITSDGGGDAEIDAGGETAVGFLIDREYPGGTVSGVDGKFQIEADEDWYDDMGTQFGFDDSGWAIKEANWDADAHDLPLIDWDGGAFNIVLSTDLYHIFKNLEFLDCADTLGLFYATYSKTLSIIGCLIKSSSNVSLLRMDDTEFIAKRLIIEGSGTGGSQNGCYFVGSSNCKITSFAIYNCGNYGMIVRNISILNNVNIGFEMSNGNEDVSLDYGACLQVFDINLGGTNGYIEMGSFQHSSCSAHIGNFQKVLGNHVTYFPGGAVGTTGGFSNVDVGDANAPSAASPAGSTTDLIAIYPNVNNYEFIEDWAVKIAEWKVWAPAAAETYTVYIQNNMGVTLNDTTAKDDIWLKLTYINAYDDASEYNKTELFSTEIDIAQRADQTDWDSLSIANHTPAVAGWAVLELYVSKYVASGQIYVDPLWV